MPQISILSARERKQFDLPPIFDKEERRRYFHIPNDVRTLISTIHKPTHRAGFLLQFAYFQAAGRFFGTQSFRARDINYVVRVFKLNDVELIDYSERMATRHRDQICALSNWKKVSPQARAELISLADRYVANQDYPERIFAGLVDLCWQRQWVVPSYTQLSTIITDCFNASEHSLLEKLGNELSNQHRQKLDSLMYSDEGSSAATLTRLKRIDHSSRATAVLHSMETLEFFKNHFFEFSSVLDSLPLGDKATDYYATWLTKADHQQFSQFPDRHKAYLHLLAFIKHQFYKRQDHAIDLLLKSITSARSYVRRQINQQDQARQKERNEIIEALRKAQLTASQFADGVVAVIKSPRATLNEKYYKIEALAHEYLAADDPINSERFSELDEDLLRSRKNGQYYDLLIAVSLKMQRRVSRILKTVEFDGESSDNDILEAIEYCKETDGRIGTNPPSDFLSNQDRNAVFDENGPSTPLYKSLLFLHVADRIKSGHLNLKYAYRYRAIQDYLIPTAEWNSHKERILNEIGLSTFTDGEAVLMRHKQIVDERFKTVNQRYLDGLNQNMSVSVTGRCRVTTPKTDYEAHSFIASTLTQKGIVPILDLLKGVDQACHFTESFRHFSTKHSKMKPTFETLMAGVLAEGCNIGLGKLAKISTGVDIDQLRNTVKWCFSQDSIRAANRKITDTIQALALANNYVNRPPSLHSSSDGRKMQVAVDSVHASYSYKYFGQDKGVTDYTFVDERAALTHALVFSSSDREAPYVLDGLVDNPVSQDLVHSTDTHGFTEQIFGAAHLMGVSFAPRIANLHQQRLYGFSTRKTYQKRGYVLLPSRTINKKLILQHWDDILRFIATIKTHRSSASQLFKRLSSYAKDHPLYKALKEYGRVVKTQFLLTYYDDVDLRQRIQKQLNLVEQANKFSRAVFFDNDQAFQDGSLQKQQAAMGCKLLLQNSIILWNYLSLSDQIIKTADPEERKQLIIAIRNGSVITWAHVNLRGEYTFTPPSANDPVFDIEKIKALRV